MKIRNATTVVATFGAATATMYITPSAEAGVINITPTIVPFFGAASQGTFVDLGIDGNASPDLWQWNDTIGNSVSLYSQENVDIIGWRLVETSQILDPATFQPFSYIPSYTTSTTYYGSTYTAGPYNIPENPFYGSNNAGAHLLGFATRGGNVGWLEVDFGAGPGSPVNYIAGAWEDSGRPIHVRGIPEPATLGLTALGLLAAGVGMRKKRTARQAAA
jgi:PEP-CTERM motif